MKIEASSLVHEAVVSIHLVPETNIEKVLLECLWKHGRLEIVNGPTFQITTKAKIHNET